MLCEGGDDGEFQVVGRRGKAVPRAARCNLKSAPVPPTACKHEPVESCQRQAVWPDGAERPRLSVAPMMAWTDLHYRTFARLLTKRTLLFTEMYPADHVIAAEADGTLDKLLGFDPAHRPIAVQIGGCCPAQMAKAASLCAKAGFDEINLNVGCPSPKVTCNHFGACLMKEPEVVKNMAQACRASCPHGRIVPVTVKHRLGVDDHDSWEELTAFVQTVAAAGVSHFVVHARKALLGVLSPEGNRTIPTLRYDWVFALARTFPHLSFELNGGVLNLREAEELLARAPEAPLTGVMIGRAAYKTPWLLSEADNLLFGVANPGLSRVDVLHKYLDHASSFFHAQQASGLVPTTLAALELEQVLAAPISYLFEDEDPGFRGTLLQEVDGREVSSTTAGQPPPFLLRSSVVRVLRQRGLECMT
mmetsp:Transcript_47992/g.154837  ORF Transcript_47992/g.154837 Transcript_47992/m.154837 type:complete len:418 (+) Transcript_47992:84-1337(+)